MAEAAPACWIIDALDEGEQRIRGVTELFPRLIRELDEAHRSSLRLVIFSRQRDWLSEFWTQLSEAYNLGPLRSIPDFQLAPLDRRAAIELVGPARFDGVVDLIRRFHLQPVAGYPVVLQFLSRQRGTEALSVEGVWRGVLQELLSEPDRCRRGSLQTEAEERFDAAAHLAAVMALTGGDQIVDETFVAEIPTLADVFPLVPGGRAARMRRAAREACEVGLFLNTAEGGYRLAQRNVLRLVERGLWSVLEAIPYAPPSEPHVIDDRHMLLSLIEERLSSSDARAILRDQEHHGATVLGLVLDHHRWLTLRQVAIDRLLAEPSLDESDQWLLTRVALERDDQRGAHFGFRVLQRCGASPSIRQHFYERGVQEWRRDADIGQRWSFALVGEDWQWLLERARREWSDIGYVWDDVYRLTRGARERGEIDGDTWDEVCRLVEEHAPGTHAHFERRLQDAERMRQEEAVETEPEPPPVQLADIVTRILDHADITADDRMRRLAWLCLVPDIPHRGLIGRWEDLDLGLRARVRSTVRQGLEQATATPIPVENSFSGDILAEGYGFVLVLDDPDQSSWLTAERIRQWLPTAIFSLHGRIPELVRRCAAIDLETAVDVLLNAAERELLVHFPLAARAWEIPVEWWTNPRVLERVVNWIHNGAFGTEARCDLLELLTLRAPEQARSIAAAWSELPDDGEVNTALLRRTGLNCRLVLDPEAGLALAESAFQRQGNIVLCGLDMLYAGHRHVRVDLNVWSVQRLERVAGLLLRAFPVRSDPDRTGRSTPVTAESELRDTRNRVFSLLLERNTPEADAALERLSIQDDGFRDRLRSIRARIHANAVVGALPSLHSDEACIPLVDAVRVLDEADFRLVRSNDDLLEVVCEVLRRIDQDIAADLSMLYSAPPGDRTPREHLQEDALQAYTRRRLLDLLPRFVFGADVRFLREDQVRFRRRLDLRVLAPRFGCQGMATVIIEIKWSDNAETETSLVEQLGRRYLLGEQETHGIYLVGWCGAWRRTGQGRRTDRAELEDYLQTQRDAFTATEAGNRLTICPVVLGIEWRDPDD